MMSTRSRTPARRRGHQRHPALIAAGAAVAVAAAAVGFTLAVGPSGDATAEPAQDSAPALGPQPTVDQLPDLGFARMGGGDPGHLGAYAGRPLVINFWASWCTPCLAELPRFEQTYQAHKDQVTFLGLNVQDSPTSAAQVVADTGLTYPLGIDPDGRLFQALGGFGMPTTLFVAADGTVLERHTGEISAEQLVDKLQTYGMVTAGS